MDLGTLTVDELIAASAELDDRADGLFDRLARIRARAGEQGIEVTVTVDGMLVGLELTPEALRLGAGRLAAEIFRLTQQACGAALAQGIDILEPIAGPDLMALITDAPGAEGGLCQPGEAEGGLQQQGEEDFSAIESWAV